MAQVPERITSYNQFTTNVLNSTKPVFLFILPDFYEDFSPNVRRFAETHPQWNIYGIKRRSFDHPKEYDAIITKYRLRSEAELM
ncbi:hypothetical protein BJY04DRAFT_215074 [Aspergillus karnatakaensis]|uniref:uncharacterized protein n=1 Tax=Aspergillus karnatakaensis TaxID=1810916 RepID=UPI003CCDA53C